MAADRSPAVYVISGPNGAGKTTFATDWQPSDVDSRQGFLTFSSCTPRS